MSNAASNTEIDWTHICTATKKLVDQEAVVPANKALSSMQSWVKQICSRAVDARGMDMELNVKCAQAAKTYFDLCEGWTKYNEPDYDPWF